MSPIRRPESGDVSEIFGKKLWISYIGRNNITTKGPTTKQFFPNIKEGLKKRLQLTPNFTATVTAHGETKAYLHTFKIIDSPKCPCETGNQTVDHLIYECQSLQKEREALTRSTTKQDSWPSEKSDLVNKYTKQLTQL